MIGTFFAGCMLLFIQANRSSETSWLSKEQRFQQLKVRLHEAFDGLSRLSRQIQTVSRQWPTRRAFQKPAGVGCKRCLEKSNKKQSKNAFGRRFSPREIFYGMCTLSTNALIYNNKLFSNTEKINKLFLSCLPIKVY